MVYLWVCFIVVIVIFIILFCDLCSLVLMWIFEVVIKVWIWNCFVMFNVWLYVLIFVGKVWDKLYIIEFFIFLVIICIEWKLFGEEMGKLVLIIFIFKCLSVRVICNFFLVFRLVGNVCLLFCNVVLKIFIWFVMIFF